MSSIEEQIEWENAMVDRGVVRFNNQQEIAVEDRAHDTSAGSYILRSYLVRISDHIALYLDGKHPEGRRRNKYAKLLELLHPDKIALFTLKSVIGSVFNNGSAVTTSCISVARCIEDELRFSKFQEEETAYYDALIRDFERKKTNSYQHKRRVLSVKGADKGVEWQTWTEEDCAGVGALAISLLMEVTDLVERQGSGNNKQSVRIVPTPQCLEWIDKHNEFAGLLKPDRMPCIIPPADWVDVFNGGYFTPRMRELTTMIKITDSAETKRQIYEQAEMPKVISAINAMQRTSWSVNTRVLSVMQEVWSKNLECGMPRSEPYEFPLSPLPDDFDVSGLSETDPLAVAFQEWKSTTRMLHTKEKERVAKNLGLVRTIQIANSMKDYDKFWYVYQCDFRGRVYSTASGLNPQGTDQAKGLIQFGEGKRLGKRGLYWFKVNGANKFGMDKISYDDRVKWVDDNEAKWKAVGEDPINNRHVWAEADKPYQFLAWCFEYWEMSRLPYKTEYVSNLPVGLDGSCNGLQHFSAMLRDAVGGKAVNLFPGEVPADIYQSVADVCLEKVIENASYNEGGAINWFKALPSHRIPRSLAKKPVMTLPYGSTKQSCSHSIHSWIYDEMPEAFPDNSSFSHALYLTPLLWDSIGEVVIAARAAMDWIQECSVIMAKAGIPLRYNSPLGFPVYQGKKHYKIRRVNTQISGRLQLSIATEGNKLNGRKQRQGASPNLVHHVDACHMMMVVNAMCKTDEEISFAMIHDDFGTHACDTEALHLAIRNEFFKLHYDTNILQNFKDTHEEANPGIELPPVPPMGDLNLRDVLNSDYFFG